MFSKHIAQSLEQGHFGVIVTDSQADKEPIVYVNKGFEEMTQYQDNLILGRNPGFLQGINSSPHAVKTMGNAVNNRRPTQVGLYNYREDGSEFFNCLTLLPVEHEKHEYYVGILCDMTAKKECTPENLHNLVQPEVGLTHHDLAYLALEKASMEETALLHSLISYVKERPDMPLEIRQDYLDQALGQIQILTNMLQSIQLMLRHSTRPNLNLIDIITKN